MSIEIIDDIEKEEGDRRCLYNVSKIMAIRYKNIILIIRKVILLKNNIGEKFDTIQ